MPACAFRLKRCPLRLAWTKSATRETVPITALLQSTGATTKRTKKEMTCSARADLKHLPWRRKKA
ncbi:MAG: hypothetical protein CL839_07560 [Crocinitomicaceae bacterium]|nr:hypothetical protein [Crocinitomicaceae bacterium]